MALMVPNVIALLGVVLLAVALELHPPHDSRRVGGPGLG